MVLRREGTLLFRVRRADRQTLVARRGHAQLIELERVGQWCLRDARELPVSHGGGGSLPVGDFGETAALRGGEAASSDFWETAERAREC